MKTRGKIKNMIIDYLFILVGTAIYALGVHVFTVPNQIAPGGITGLATAINALTGIPIGTFFFTDQYSSAVAGAQISRKRLYY